MPTAIDEYPLSDLLYRAAALTDDTGQVVEAYDTDAYGNTIAYDDPGPDGQWFTDDDVQTDQPTCQYIFTGREFDPESQIYFYRARYYDPMLGRFISRDIVYANSLENLYKYVDGNPLILLDPSGWASTTPSSVTKCLIACKCLSANVDVKGPTWQTFDEGPLFRVGFNNVCTFSVTGDPKQCTYHEDETGTLTSKVQGNSQLPPGKTTPTQSNPIRNEWLHFSKDGATFTDKAGYSYGKNIGGGSSIILTLSKDYSVLARCTSSDGTEVKSPQYSVTGTTTAKIMQNGKPPTLDPNKMTITSNGA